MAWATIWTYYFVASVFLVSLVCLLIQLTQLIIPNIKTERLQASIKILGTCGVMITCLTFEVAWIAADIDNKPFGIFSFQPAQDHAKTSPSPQKHLPPSRNQQCAEIAQEAKDVLRGKDEIGPARIAILAGSIASQLEQCAAEDNQYNDVFRKIIELSPIPRHKNQ